MTHQLHQHPCAYIVSIRFETDGINFAQERYRIEASDPCEAARLGRARARDSVYHDERIPGLRLVAQVEEGGRTSRMTIPIMIQAGRLGRRLQVPRGVAEDGDLRGPCAG